MKRKAQTATEYLIILAVMIVIALIIVGVLRLNEDLEQQQNNIKINDSIQYLINNGYEKVCTQERIDTILQCIELEKNDTIHSFDCEYVNQTTCITFKIVEKSE
jgi:hypothetical protein